MSVFVDFGCGARFVGLAPQRIADTDDRFVGSNASVNVDAALLCRIGRIRDRVAPWVVVWLGPEIVDGYNDPPKNFLGRYYGNDSPRT
jgi:hypothetical protein